MFFIAILAHNSAQNFTKLNSDRTKKKSLLEGLYGCFKTCNVFLAGNSEVSLELQCLREELITYIVCECDAPE